MQDELFERPDFCPIMPPRGSAAWTALVDLLERDSLNHIEWINEFKGWRLSAGVKSLNYLGWNVLSEMRKCKHWPRAIAFYSLSKQAKQAAASFLKGGQPCA